MGYTLVGIYVNWVLGQNRQGQFMAHTGTNENQDKVQVRLG